MIIRKVILKNIKSFKGTVEFNFENSSNLYTISGINGSGKTTLFKSIIIAQRVFFFDQVQQDRPFAKSINLDLLNYFTLKGSEVSIYFEMEGVNGYLPNYSIVCTERNHNFIKWNLVCSEEDKATISQFWNYENPKKVIVYIESNRFINEGDFTHEGVSLKSSKDENNLALDYIFQPEKLFSSIYEKIISDYIRERVIPNKPRKDLPHVASKVLIHKLLTYLQINNFTGLIKDDQFILQIKSLSGNQKKNSIYDFRNLSSGEKTIFYILHFICYVNNIGMLIIDEPENNLHENLLTSFVNLLNQICTDPDFGSLIEKISKENGITLKEDLKKQIKNFYENHELSQVYLLTHSKNLIYNNFTIGSNFIISNGLEQLKYDEAEQILRTIGLSRIQNKVLFVEGQTEIGLLYNLLSPFNIKVRSLKNCYQVIETYDKYLNLKESIRDVQFCFMIDNDTRNDEEIKKLQDKDPASFKKYFLIIDRHEVENYFLDSGIYTELYKNHKALSPSLNAPAEQEIKDKIEEIATKHKEAVIKKTLQNLNQKSFGKLKVAVSTRTLPVSNESDYNTYIDETFDGDVLEETINNIKENYKLSLDYVSNWSADWINICDGKIVYNEYLAHVAKDIGVKKTRLEDEVINIAKESNKFLVKSLLKSILDKFKEN